MSLKSLFTGNIQRRGKSRIIYDVKNIEKNKDNLNNQEGLYFKFNIDDSDFSSKYKMLIVGPDDTPYVGGLYLFNAQFPDQYPYRPMKMTSMTQGGGIRKHPNLYVCGKCCFSFLGTWTGPPWSACQNPTTVGISMRSVLTNNPIVNEPGWEKRNDPNTKLYENLIRYFNIRYAVIEILENFPVNYLDFKKEIINIFIKNYSKYKIEVNKFIHLNKKVIKSPVYNFEISVNCDALLKSLENLYFKFTGKTSFITVHNTTRKCPVKPASKYDTNTVKDGLDGRSWKVKLYPTGKKRWVLNR